MNNAVAIIVTYNSDLQRLSKIIESLLEQIRIVVCDNSERHQLRASIKNLAVNYNIDYLPMPSNIGIASAQNAGIKYAKQFSPHFILFMDDDSIPEPNLVIHLFSAYQKLSSLGGRVGSVSARSFDPAGNDVSNVKSSYNEFDLCQYMRSSGTLISVNVLDTVGLMDETLFIDCVDFDWGFRAQQKNYNMYIANSIHIEHLLGEKSIFMFGVRLGIPSPIRHYYQFRNILTMLTRDYVPIRWRIKQFFYLFLKLLIIPILVEPRLSRMYYMFQGIKDWIINKNGKFMSERDKLSITN